MEHKHFQILVKWKKDLSLLTIYNHFCLKHDKLFLDYLQNTISSFFLHNFCVSTFLILVAWGQVSLIGWQFVMLRRCLIISLGLLWFVAVSTISSICLHKVYPRSIQMLCNTIHARVLSLTSSCALSHFLWRTRHLPLSSPYASSMDSLALLSL